MGTRHYQKVYDSKGRLKVAQYGQWDGYPSGQGAQILHFLTTVKLEKYESSLSTIRFATEADLKEFDEESTKLEARGTDWATVFPHFSRDCGSDVHWLILRNKVDYLPEAVSQAEADKWCDGFYTINFRDRTFTAEFGGIVKVYSLDNLPTLETFLSDFGEE